VRVYMRRSWALDGVVNCRGSTPALVRPGGLAGFLRRNSRRRRRRHRLILSKAMLLATESSQEAPGNELLQMEIDRREVPTEAPPPPRCFVVAKPGRDLEHLVRCFPRYGASWGEGCTRDRVAQDLKFMSDSTLSSP
jgi:hypothetical protein